jgi:DNA polymerase III delta subunit
MLYMFLGESPQEKDQKIGALKKSVLQTSDAEKFDYSVLDAQRCSPEELKKNLLGLPAVAEQRLLVVRNSHKLSPQNKDILKDFMASQPQHIVIVLESSKNTLPKKIAGDLKPYARLETFYSAYKPTVFDVAQKIRDRDATEALKQLTEILDGGEQPVKFLGGLAWDWGHKMKRRVSPQAFESGLQALQRADLNIKRTRLQPRQALEVVVVELLQLMD